MAKIFVSVPILDRPELSFMHSLYQAILTCPQHQVRLYFNQQDSLISRVRNVHCSVFLNEFPECDYFCSFDSDIEIVNCYPNNNIFAKLIAHDKDFVGGLYAIKKPGVKRSSSITLDGTNPQFDTGLKEMRWLSSGCWCVKRSAMQKMADSYKELHYDGDDNASGKRIYGVYMPMIYRLKPNEFPGIQSDFDKLCSEDWSFCQRWRDIGGQIFADTSIVLKHIGRHEYTLWDLDVVKTKAPVQPIPPPAGFDLGTKK